MAKLPSELPTGTVTFLFTDIEGSTSLLQRLGDRYGQLLDTHAGILRTAISEGGGVEVATEGDAFFAVFSRPAGAVAAAVGAQRELAAQSWPEGYPVRVRMGLHTGEGVLGGDNYIGIDVHRAARIAAAAHGGQVLLSGATQALGAQTLPSGVELLDMGRHRLKDIVHPEHLYQLVIDDLGADFPPIRSLDARLTNLPLERTSFVGREHQVAEVAGLLERGRMVTLTGPGGTGKTRLALKVASDRLEDFSDGVFLVDLSAVIDPRLVPLAIAEALRVHEQPGQETFDSLAGHLREREMLLVLDNFEQVADAAKLVGSLLDAAPRLTVLATSRVPLHLSGEQEYHVPPLGLPDPDRLPGLEALSQYEGVKLFVERATAVRPEFQVTNDNAPAVAEIAARLDGLPLAIELAAGRVKVLSPEALLARLGQRLPLLTGKARDLPERQRTLRGAIEWSHDLLGPEDNRLFARLAAFAGGWTLEAAESVCGEGLEVGVLDGLESLVDNSLVRQGEAPGGETRFSMLETIREYSAERLAASGEEDEIRRRHAEHFRGLAEEAESHLIAEDRVLWIARLEREHDNLRAALDWAERTGDSETGLRTAAAVWRLWQLRGHLSEARARLERLLSLPAAEARGRVRVRGLGALGGIAYWQNDVPATRTAYQEAVDIAREVGDSKLLAQALYDYSYVPFLDQDLDAAEAIIQEGLPSAEQAGDRPLMAEFWTGMAFLEFFRGNQAGSIDLLSTAVEIFREEGAAWRVAELLAGLGMITRATGDIGTAVGHFREALDRLARAGDLLSIPQGLVGLAFTANDGGRHARAARLMGASAAIRDRLGGGAPPELMGRWGDPEADARAALDEDAFRRARAEGYAMSIEEAVAYALAND